MLAVDPSARVAAGAVIGADVKIGPYCVIGPNVALGDSVPTRGVGHPRLIIRTAAP